MRIFLAILSGFVLTLTIFAGGALSAIFFVNAEPVQVHPLDMDTNALWTSKAVRVNTDSQDFARFPARPVLSQSKAMAQAPNEAEETAAENQIDLTTTAALPTQDASEPKPPAQDLLRTEHVAWCSSHYRSYDQGDDRYTAYSGVRRECISPDSGGGSRHQEPEILNASDEGSPALITAAYSEEMPTATVDTVHMQSCFDRYRSYRPEDNTYQPYGGGPRQQCE